MSFNQPTGIEPGWYYQQTTGTTTIPVNNPNNLIVPNTTNAVWSTVPAQPDKSMFEQCVQSVGDKFILIRGAIDYGGKSIYQILSKTKNVRFLSIEQELLVPKYIWDAILMYLMNDEGKQYADLPLHEFLDKLTP